VFSDLNKIRTKQGFATALLPFRKRFVDSSGRLVVLLPEEVGIGSERDVWRAVPYRF
jgi:hypothetical protein